MTRFNRIIQPAVLSALLLSFSLSSSANEIQDANKFFKRGQPAQALVKVALTLGVGYLMVLWHPERRALHDLIAGTKVVMQR